MTERALILMAVTEKINSKIGFDSNCRDIFDISKRAGSCSNCILAALTKPPSVESIEQIVGELQFVSGDFQF